MKKRKRKTKKNPTLIRVNPSREEVTIDDYMACKRGRDGIEACWKKAKKLSPRLTRRYFNKAIDQYIRQHHCLPEEIKKIDVPGLDKKHKIMIHVGESEEILYCPRYGRKLGKRGGKIKYVHRTEKQDLLTDPDGKVLIYRGKTKMKADGWLHD